MIYKKEALALLRAGATIEFTAWGFDYPIYIRFGEIYERIHRKSYDAIQDQLVIVKQACLDYTYKLKGGNEE